MSIDMYGEAVASACELIREFAKTEYFHYFSEGDVEGKLESFIAMMDSCREEGRVKGRAEALAELHPAWLAEKERADKAEARLNWLADQTIMSDYGDNAKKEIGWRIYQGNGLPIAYGSSINEAIDAARLPAAPSTGEG